MKKKKENYYDLFESAMKHQQFYVMQVSHLTSVLDEIEVIGDELMKRLVKNAKERHEIDKMIFTRRLFKE